MGHAMRGVIGEGFSESHGLWIILSEALNKWWNMEGVLRLKMKSEQTLRNRTAACPVPQSLSITPTLWYITKEDARHTWRWRPMVRLWVMRTAEWSLELSDDNIGTLVNRSVKKITYEFYVTITIPPVNCYRQPSISISAGISLQLSASLSFSLPECLPIDVWIHKLQSVANFRL